VIGVNKTHPKPRKRFTIAHEVGHFLLHDEAFSVDRHYVVADSAAFRPVALRSSSSGEASDPREVEANRFAAALLMPVELLAKELPKYPQPMSHSSVLALAKKCEVSGQAMTYRLVNLGVPLDLAGDRTEKSG